MGLAVLTDLSRRARRFGSCAADFALAGGEGREEVLQVFRTATLCGTLCRGRLMQVTWGRAGKTAARIDAREQWRIPGIGLTASHDTRPNKNETTIAQRDASTSGVEIT